MATKRVNNEFHRLDIKLPIDVYKQISKIAVNSFSARIHHISGKPEITQTLIYLLELGIQSFLDGNELIKKYDTDKYTDTIPITEKGVKQLIKEELVPIQSRLNELSKVIHRLTYTDNNTDIISIAVNEGTLAKITDNNADKYADKIEIDTDNISPSESLKGT